MKPYQDKKTLEELYLRFKSQTKIAEHLNCNSKTIAAWMKKFEIESVGSQGARKNKFNENFFETIDSEEKAYWLGFIYADGCIYKGSDKKSYRLQINLKLDDIDMLRKFQNSIESSYKIQEKAIGNTFACLLKVNSTKMCEDLMDKGVFPRKSLKLKFPSNEIVPKYLVRHFIRGYFDGDGSISKIKDKNHYKIDICSNEEFLIELEKHLIEAGTSKFSYDRKKQTKAVSLKSARDNTIKIFYEYAYADATMFLERKKKKFEDFMNVPFRSNSIDKMRVNCGEAP